MRLTDFPYFKVGNMYEAKVELVGKYLVSGGRARSMRGSQNLAVKTTR